MEFLRFWPFFLLLLFLVLCLMLILRIMISLAVSFIGVSLGVSRSHVFSGGGGQTFTTITPTTAAIAWRRRRRWGVYILNHDILGISGHRFLFTDATKKSFLTQITFYIIQCLRMSLRRLCMMCQVSIQLIIGAFGASLVLFKHRALRWILMPNTGTSLGYPWLKFAIVSLGLIYLLFYQGWI